MKFNFKKIATVLGSAVLVGSTIGFAAAANYPAPFSQEASAIVVGSAAQSLDVVAAANIASNLAAANTVSSATGSTATATGGDNVLLQKGSELVHLGDDISSIWGSSITKSNLPTLLADGTYRNKQNTEYDFTQKINLGSQSFGFFSDSDYMDKAPTLGFKLAGGSTVLNYTLDFTTKPESSFDSNNNLLDIETTDVTILGKTYYVLDAKNLSGTTGKLVLLDSAVSQFVSEGDSSSVILGNTTYNVTTAYVGSSSVRLSINGETTTSLSEGGTYKLTDGTYVGIKSILYNSKDSGVSKVEFSLGKGKLELSDGSVVKLNEKDISDLTAYVPVTNSSSKVTLNKVIIQWKLDDKKFLANASALVMPGFENIKLSMANVEFPAEEKTTVEYSGDDVLQLKTTLKDGDVTIPLLKLNTTTGNFSLIGKASDERLATSNNTYLFYNASSGLNTGFVASWNNTRDSESYYLTASVSRDSDAAKTNRTTIKNKVTGSDICSSLTVGDTCTIGNVVLTVGSVNYTSADNRFVNFTINGNGAGSFNTLYTAKGLMVELPYESTNTSTDNGAINLSSGALAGVSGHNVDVFTLTMTEADKDGNIARGNATTFNITNSGTTTRRVTVSTVGGALPSGGYETSSGSKIFDYFVYSPLATEILFDKTSSDQYSADVIYHGAEVAANVFLSTPSATITSATPVSSGVGAVTVFDNEVASVQSKNLIVVGGSCVNTVAATLLGSATPLCGADFTTKAKVGSGQFLVQVFNNPYTTGKIAMLVAGYDAADTQKAATYLTTNVVNTAVGTVVKKTSATYADVA